MNSLQKLSWVVVFVCLAVSGGAHANEYHKLSLQEKADLARYLGWVWGDGRPGADGRGILYKGGNPNYTAVVSRLANVRFDGRTNALGFPTSGNRKLVRAWNYWENSLPGGNPGDPQILREAIKHPNFLAGLLEGEGQIFHSDPNKEFYIADQSYAPSHPDKLYDIANFGPERMVQLLKLMDETYGFKNPSLLIGKTSYDYATRGDEAIRQLRNRYRELDQQNRNGNLQNGFTVKVRIKPRYFSQISSYGYFFKGDGKYRTPAPDSQLRIIRSSFPDQNTEVSGPLSFLGNEGGKNDVESEGANPDSQPDGNTAGLRLLHSSGGYLSSRLGIVGGGNRADVRWELVDLRNGFVRVKSRNTAAARSSLRATENAVVGLTGATTTAFTAQWRVESLPDASGRFYLVNRFYGTYLRIASGNGSLQHGRVGEDAIWQVD